MGGIIFREDAFPTGIFYISQGKVKKYKVDHEIREFIIYIANTGELLGNHAILAQGRYPDIGSALEKSIIGFIPKEDFLDALAQSPLDLASLIGTAPGNVVRILTEFKEDGILETKG